MAILNCFIISEDHDSNWNTELNIVLDTDEAYTTIYLLKSDSSINQIISSDDYISLQLLKNSLKIREAKGSVTQILKKDTERTFSVHEIEVNNDVYIMVEEETTKKIYPKTIPFDNTDAPNIISSYDEINKGDNGLFALGTTSKPPDPECM